MPLVDSFLVDHTIMPAPSVRCAKVLNTPKGDIIEVWDLRFVKPNTAMMPEKGIHTLEHFFAGFMREHINEPNLIEVIDISPMGCKTGFYMSLIGQADPNKVSLSMLEAMQDIANLKDDIKIPASNAYQCGSCNLHSLSEAKAIANMVLKAGIVVVNNEDIALDSKKIQDLQ
ncbi:MAG: S-ribosylhomocysteine lyase [Succinatimonas sp.]|nr:S-ribosylhomocysteine lyase [Succinatimonas sp.]